MPSFLAAAPFFVGPFDFCGTGGCNASATASSIALEKAGSTLARPGGGVVGLIGHDVSTGAALFDDFLAFAAFLAAFFAALASSAAFAGADSGPSWPWPPLWRHGSSGP